MRLINLDIDDLHIISTYIRGEDKADLSLKLELGEEVDKFTPNSVLFPANKDFDLFNNTDFNRNTFNLLLKNGQPTITAEKLNKRDKGIKGLARRLTRDPSNSFNILFTGVYRSDCKTLLSDIYLRFTSKESLDKVELIGAGYMPDNVTQEPQLNMVLLVPKDMQYELDGLTYSCATGKKVLSCGAGRIDMDSLLLELEKKEVV